MNFIKIKEELYQTILNQLMKFAASNKAQNVYAIALDLDEFDYVVKYQTITGYCETKAKYINECLNCPEYRDDYFNEDHFNDESLVGLKYSVGDFCFVDEIAEEKLSASKYLKDFFASMAYYECDYIDNESRIIPREELPENFYMFLIETCLYCAEKLKDNLDFLSKTDDFIIFVAEHDMSNERKLNLILKTVEKHLFEKLCQN